jgi:opacity protein-like surface antigen
VRFVPILAVALFAIGPAAAADQQLFVHPDPGGWVFGVRAIVGASSEDTDFESEPAGAIDADEDSYDPQENFGAGAFVGYEWMGWGVPLRAELSGSWMYRHDADMIAEFAAPEPRRNYQSNLAIWDVRLSLLADVLTYSWGSLYVGAGLGAAFLDSEVTLNGTGESADNDEWKLSPSLQTGLVFDDVLGAADIELAYRFRWFGDTESGEFSDGARVTYEDVHIHDVMLGVVVPLGPWSR